MKKQKTNKDIIPFTYEEMRNAKGIQKLEMLRIYKDWRDKVRKEGRSELNRLRSKIYYFNNILAGNITTRYICRIDIDQVIHLNVYITKKGEINENFCINYIK